MSTTSNRVAYLKSLADELSSQSHRVRDLIGSNHWLSDGHHKEYLFLSLLRRHLPHGFVASRGFVVGHSDPSQCSKEQDVLIVDTAQESPLFYQGGLLISFPHSVRAAISIKTTPSKSTIVDAISGLASIFSSGMPQPHADLWMGVYMFEPSPNAVSTLLSQIDDAHNDARQHNATPSDWTIDGLVCSPSMLCLPRCATCGDGNSVRTIRAYDVEKLATAFFIGHLLDHLAISRGATDSPFLAAMDALTLSPEAQT